CVSPLLTDITFPTRSSKAVAASWGRRSSASEPVTGSPKHHCHEEENDRHSGDKRRGERALHHHGCLRNRRAWRRSWRRLARGWRRRRRISWICCPWWLGPHGSWVEWPCTERSRLVSRAYATC